MYSGLKFTQTIEANYFDLVATFHVLVKNRYIICRSARAVLEIYFCSVLKNPFNFLQVNPGGNYPVNLINLVARKQPMCIAYLRKYIVETRNMNMTM